MPHDSLSFIDPSIQPLLARRQWRSLQMAAALHGDLNKGLLFRGTVRLPFGAQTRSVREPVVRLRSAGPRRFRPEMRSVR
jgi:hypothetical protein